MTGGSGEKFRGAVLINDEAAGSSMFQCVVADNLAWAGGGLYSLAGITLQECRFLRNHAVSRGGGLLASGPTTVSSCTFSSNTAEDRGGAIYGHALIAVVTTSTFYCSQAPEGSAMMLTNGSNVSVDRCLIAFGQGDAVRCRDVVQFSIVCSDIFGNSGGDWVDVESGGCLANHLGQDGNLSADPLFCAADPEADGSWGLRSDSPCAPSQSGCGLIGAWDVDCEAVRTESTSWGELKARFR